MPITSMENTFIAWSKRSSDTEEQQCENALKMIKNAIKSYDKFKDMDIEFIPQGSYYNNTNVRNNSDVDICVRLTSSLFVDYPEGVTDSTTGLVNGTYTFSNYLNDIENALIQKFGRGNVTKGNKAFDIHSNTYRVDADVVACFEHRRYDKNCQYIKGTQFITKDGDSVTNFPEQHYSNGVAKNNKTCRRYKRVVRILKRAKMKMVEEGIQGLENISSFLIECLVWNVEDKYFNNLTFTEDVKNVLVYLYSKTKEANSCKEWGEVSDLIYLFHSGRNYTREEVNLYIVLTYNYLFE